MLTWDLGGGGLAADTLPVGGGALLPIYGSTDGVSYLFKVRPFLKDTTTTATSRATVNERYWTLLFWSNRSLTDTQPGNNAIFQWKGVPPANVADTYYGAHPYPFGGTGAPFGIPQRPEISVYGNDYDAGVEWTWGSWIKCMFTARRTSATDTEHHFYYDLDRAPGTFLNGSLTFAGWAATNPPNPSITCGQSPFKTYTGDESFCGDIAELHFFDNLLSEANANAEFANPGSSGKQIWYRNTRPDSVMADQSGQGHNPFWVGTAATVIAI